MVLSQFFFFCLPAKLVTARDEAILLSPLWLALYLPLFVKSSQQPLSELKAEEKITFPGQGGISGHLLDVREMRMKSGTSFC
jgi:hypothetical protein